MSGYYPPAQPGYGYPAPQPGYPGPGASPYPPPNPQQNMYQASPYPQQQQPDYYQQQQQQQQQHQGMYPPPNSGGPPAGYPGSGPPAGYPGGGPPAGYPGGGPPAGYPGTMPPQHTPPQYQVSPGAPGYPDPQSMPTSAPYPPATAPHDQPPQPYDAYQEARKADPAASQSYYGGDQKGAEFWMQAYPRPSVGPQPLTPEQMEMWHYHITYNPNNKQKPPTSSTSSTAGEAGSFYPGAAAQPGYGYSQPQQQQQQSMYQAPPPAESAEQHEGKQGTDWMKLAGGMAAGGIALAGTKKLFGRFTGDKTRSADEH